MNMIEIRQLRHFMAVVEAKGFRAASRVVHLSPPALTRSIQMLEEHYGMPLLIRNPRAVTPTALGQQLMIHARRVVNDFDDIPHHLSDLAACGKGRLRVGLSPVVQDSCMPAIMQRLMRDYADIEISLHVAASGALVGLLEQHHVDLIVCADGALKPLGNLSRTKLAACRACWWGRAEHPLALTPAPTIDAYADYPLIHQQLPVDFLVWKHDVAGQVRKHTGKTMSVDAALQCDSYSLMVKTVLESDALMLMPVRNAIVETRHHQLVPIPLPVPIPDFGLTAAHLTSKTASPVVTLFVSLMQAQLAALDAKARQAGLTDLLPEQSASS